MTTPRIDQCSRCGACSEEEAETRCRPMQDSTGEYGCPGTEWPLADVWAGTLTVAEAEEKVAAEDAYWAEEAERLRASDLAAGPDWDAWADALSPGDPCRVRWQGVTWDAKVQRIAPEGPTVLLIAAAGTLVPMEIGWEDIEPLPTTEAP